MELALTVVAGDAGLADHFGTVARVLMPSMLAALGWTDVEVREEGADVIITAVTNGPVALAALAYAAQPVAGDADRLVLTLLRSPAERPRVVHVPLPAFLQWDNAEVEPEKDVAFMQLACAITADGSPLFNPQQAEKYVAVRGLELLATPNLALRELARRVNLWRAAAAGLGLTDVRRALGQGLRYRGEAAAGGLAPDPKALEKLTQYASASVPGLPESLV